VSGARKTALASESKKSKPLTSESTMATPRTSKDKPSSGIDGASETPAVAAAVALPPDADGEIAERSEPERDHDRDLDRDAEADALTRAERGLPSVNRATAISGRVTRLLGTALMGALALGALGAYYAQTATRSTRESAAATQLARDRAAGDSTVPPLGRVDLPAWAAPAPVADAGTGNGLPERPLYIEPEYTVPGYEIGAGSSSGAANRSVPWVETVLERPIRPRPSSAQRGPDPWGTAPAGVPPGEAPFDAGLAGPEGFADGTTLDPELARQLSGEVLLTNLTTGLGLERSAPTDRSASRSVPSAHSLESRLQPAVVETVSARQLPTRRLLLPRGATLDCTLETAIDSSLPGLVTCLTARPTFGADGRVVLLERGTRLVGEVGGAVRRGERRLFVLWSEARTPTGIVVDLASPGTDAQGRAGLTGDIERHFGERFGAALLLSVLDGAIQAGVEASRRNEGSSIVVSPAGSQDLIGEVLKDSVGIVPTISVAPGTRVTVLVARDVDFRAVYALERVQP